MFAVALAVLVGTTNVYANVVVSPSDMNGWAFGPDSGTAGTGQMVSGPSTPPTGPGSAQMTATLDTDRFMLGTIGHNSTKLSDITSLMYSTYRNTGGSALAIALQFNIDTDITDSNIAWQGRLVYEPYYTQTVLDDTWQTWNTLSDSGTGNWWFSGAPGNVSCSIGNPCTWNEVKTAFPNAGIHATLGATLFKVGGGWTGFDGNVDNFTIGVSGVDTTYDFELVAPVIIPENKDQCKNGGWQSFTNPSFKNQGECVSSVVSQNE